MYENAKLLSRPINFAVVQLPERNFPGVVVQGDSLHNIIHELNSAINLLKENNIDQALYDISAVRDTLSGAITHYEHVCKSNDISLPY